MRCVSVSQTIGISVMFSYDIRPSVVRCYVCFVVAIPEHVIHWYISHTVRMTIANISEIKQLKISATPPNSHMHTVEYEFVWVCECSKKSQNHTKNIMKKHHTRLNINSILIWWERNRGKKSKYTNVNNVDDWKEIEWKKMRAANLVKLRILNVVIKQET